MRKFLQSKKKKNLILILLLMFCFIQSIIIAKLYNSKDDKVYEVNLVKINQEKDSLDYLQLKTDLGYMDITIRNLNNFLKSKNVSDLHIERLAKDSLSNYVYLAKTSNRYSQYLVDLEKKLQSVPLGVPTEGYVSSNFGPRKNPIPNKATNKVDTLDVTLKNNTVEKDQIQYHKGIDIGASYGTNVKCTASGKVIFAGVKSGYGNCVIVEHANGLSTLYAHLSDILVDTNDRVKNGQVIAKSGNTGRSTGPHLHYEVLKNKKPINPKLFLTL